MNILRKRMSHLINQSISDEAVYRTAPATPGLLIIVESLAYLAIYRTEGGVH